MNNENNQSKWDGRFLKIAKEISTWSKDPSTQIGAVLVGDHNQIISQGYNGFPRGVNDTKERYENREEKYKFTVHGEANCVYNAIHSSANIRGSTIYVHGLPVCSECAKLIIQTGVSRVVMGTISVEKQNGRVDWSESSKLALVMFDEAKVEYTFIKS